MGCRKRQARPGEQQMAYLPEDRITPGKPPFSYVGINFFGALYNGGNLVSGNNEIRTCISDWNQAQIHEYLLQKDIRWIFNPPTGSHHGAVWERCIITIRKIMAALNKQQTIDDEGLNTFMCEIEAIVNGRPITTVSNDHRDKEPLTPNHLLLLRSSIDLPIGRFEKADLYAR